MTTTELAKKVKEMRDAQIKYFTYREHGNIYTNEQLQLSKKLEKELDKTVDEILNPKPNNVQGKLF